jgi:hypothetical protein
MAGNPWIQFAYVTFSNPFPDGSAYAVTFSAIDPSNVQPVCKGVGLTNIGFSLYCDWLGFDPQYAPRYFWIATQFNS